MPDLAKTTFVVFSDDWGRHPSSCQHLFRRIALDHRVLWVNTIGLRSAKADKFTVFRGLEKLKEWSSPVRRISDDFWVLAPIMLPVSGGWAGRVNVELVAATVRQTMRRMGFRRPILFSSIPTAVDYVGKIAESAVVYYVTDDYSLWPGGNPERIRAADASLAARADLILACTQSLANKWGRPDRTLLLPHAVDFEHFATPAAPPADLAGIPHPRACYFGLIWEKIDLDLLDRLAEQAPELQVIMIGPVKTDVARLAARPNVHILGPRPYEQMPAYLQAMDLLVVPYVLDEQIAASGPLKIRECLAVGKPVVARSIPALEEFADVVYLYRNREDFVRLAKSALASTDGDADCQARRRRVSGQSWNDRVRTIYAAISSMRLAPADRGVVPEVMPRIQCDAPSVGSWLTDRMAGIFSDIRWPALLQEAYGCHPYYLIARRGAETEGVLPLVLQRNLVRGFHLAGLPYFDSCGAVASEVGRVALIGAARGLLSTTGADWMELRQEHRIPELPAREDKVVLRLALPRTTEELWTEFSPKVRNQIRKAEKAGLTVLHGGMELLADFHAVYCRNMRDLGSPPHSRRFFELICQTFPEACRLFVVRMGERAVAASVTLVDRRGLHVPWAGSDWRYSELCGNMLLYFAMLSYACERGLPEFDFGRSTRESGTYRFKKQWGAQEHPLYWHYLLRPGTAMPDMRTDSPKYQRAIAVWKKLPVSLCKWLGPSIIARLT